MKLYKCFCKIYRRSSKRYRLTNKERQISPPLTLPFLFCCFIYLSTFIFYIVEQLKKGKGKTNEKKSHDVFNANDVSFCGRRNDC
ncbi:hypothetical protein COD05_27530 [Bacillus cereus]|nr:hypothetical protein CN431_27100 [Bacillus cereus]PFW80924.1 hypothetical protein COL27_20870 [Bacillus sp. AFS075960]PFF84701.1 hypothetical protein CN338_22735 [Bacillus cereus]PFI46386.1 hypothetical protein COI76_28290 [Bacillus cereus]PFM11835.1 hypothetical protein COJ40_08660 [Bacillus cereus]